MVHFCPALYNYVVKEMHRHIILVLNKVDAAPVELVTAWKMYLKEKYSQLHVVCFTSRPRDACAVGSDPVRGQYFLLVSNQHVLKTGSVLYIVFHIFMDIITIYCFIILCIKLCFERVHYVWRHTFQVNLCFLVDFPSTLSS